MNIKVKHTVLMICYNQERYIEVALDSLLCETIKPYEIIIGDDASSDGTREILDNYKKKYPDIINLVLNEKNMGIFANLNNLVKKASGDMIHFLAGDDWYKPHFLENTNKYINEKQLDLNTEKFIFLPNDVVHSSDGSERVRKNDPKIIGQYSPLGIVLRDLVYWRHVCLSRALFEKYPPFPEDMHNIGYWADRVQHIMLAQHIEKQYIVDFVGPVYREGIGVSSKASRYDLDRSYCAALREIFSLCESGELKLNRVDYGYLKFLIITSELKLQCNCFDYLKCVRLGLRQILINKFDFRPILNVLFIIPRRLLSGSFVGTIWRRYN
ncbi:MAG: glycosyltransferase family 2 protein [Desulfuromonadales bacterium]|nr:glycosyltransferase family 2 protein [Desulfuromonadales bacterium]